nr:lipase family protein [Nocardia terpenica]
MDRGWTVAVPDGEGFVAPGPHKFLAARAAGHAVLDIARAVRALPDIDAAGAPVLIWGYADGGRAAIMAAEQQPDCAPRSGCAASRPGR